MSRDLAEVIDQLRGIRAAPEPIDLIAAGEALEDIANTILDISDLMLRSGRSTTTD